jgi:fructoselysine-6-P-deglycase FrlB-like protein
MILVSEELASQPAVWRRAVGLARSLSAMLPAPHERVAYFGCGTSFHIAQAAAALREQAAGRESDAFAASELPASRAYDMAVAISRSGTTTEVLELTERLQPRVPVLALTADADSPLAELASRSVALPFANERSVVQTRFATAALALLRAAAGNDMAEAIDDAERALVGSLPMGVDGVRQLVFLGTGWTVGLAQEAALKVREAAQAWSEAYPAMEYRHGPISTAEPGTVVWALSPLPPGLEEEIRATGARLIVPSLDPMAELVRAQRVAVALAEARGLDPDHPRHLTRSVVLAGDGLTR